jgi:BspA type Leucine rich repeat region (6 copies)
MLYIKLDDNGFLVKQIGWDNRMFGVAPHFTIPDFNCHTIDDNVFENNYDLLTIKMTNRIKTIGSNAFQNCKYLKSVELPDKLKVIGDNAFRNCTSLTSIKIPDSVEVIGSRAFYNCVNLEKANIPYYAKVGESAFLECPKLHNLSYL